MSAALTIAVLQRQLNISEVKLAIAIKELKRLGKEAIYPHNMIAKRALEKMDEVQDDLL